MASTSTTNTSVNAGVDKENVAPLIPLTSKGKKKGLGLAAAAPPASSSTTPTTGNTNNNNAQENEENNVPDLPLKKMPPSSSQKDKDKDTTSLPRLLLFTERPDEVFMLDPPTLPETTTRRTLAQAIIDDRGNPTLWWALLHHVHQVFGSPSTCDPKHAPQIRKLYQKATRIIPDTPKQDKEDPALVNIWLGFAAAEGRVSESDAREAYAHMNRSGIGAKTAEFYLSYAAFEERSKGTKEAINIIQSGITRGASPLEPLLRVLKRLRTSPAPPPPSSSSSTTTTTTTTTLLSPPATSSTGTAPAHQAPDALPTTMPQPTRSSTRSTTSPPQSHDEEEGRRTATKTKPTPTTPAPPSTHTHTHPDDNNPHTGQGLPTTTTNAPKSSSKESQSQTHTQTQTQTQTQAQTKSALKAKRLVPSGRLLGLGRAERVRFETPSKPDKEGEDNEGDEDNTEKRQHQDKKEGETERESEPPLPPPSSLSHTHTHTQAPPPVTPKNKGTSSSMLDDLSMPVSVCVPTPLTGILGRIEEDEVTGGGKGSDDTAGSHHAGGNGNSTNHSRHPHTGEVTYRVQVVKTPLTASRGGGQINTHTHTHTPGSAVRPSGAAPSSSTSCRLRSDSAATSSTTSTSSSSSSSSSSVAPLGEADDMTHTRDRGRAASMSVSVSAAAIENGGGGDKRRLGSLDEVEEVERSAAAQAHTHTHAHAQVAPRSHAPQQQQHHPSHPPQPQAQAPPQQQQQRSHTHAQQQQQPPPPPQPQPTHIQTHTHTQQFSFDTLLASRNFMTLNHTQYLRLDVLGRGGSSKVFRVLSDSGQIYALKRVRVPPKDSKALESFANEITLLSRLKGHPCIIQLVDSSVDRHTGLVLMLMELGEIDLNKLLSQSAAEEGGQGRLSLNFIRFIWEQMLRAVHCVHEERIVHGDLKPANFVFVRGRLKLIDFGIAKALGNDTTNIMRESQVGTVNYMSPEAILDTGNGREQPGGGGRRAPLMKIGRASDVWSLGCILYQLVYGKTPFAELNLIQKLHCIVDEGYEIAFPPSASSGTSGGGGGGEIHPDVRDTIQQCLRRDPTTRPPIAGGEGSGSLLQHPFLVNTSSSSSSSSLTVVRQTIEATLAVVEKEPAVLSMGKTQEERVGVVLERISKSGGGGVMLPPAAAAAPVAAGPKGRK